MEENLEFLLYDFGLPLVMLNVQNKYVGYIQRITSPEYLFMVAILIQQMSYKCADKFLPYFANLVSHSISLYKSAVSINDQSVQSSYIQILMHTNMNKDTQ